VRLALILTLLCASLSAQVARAGTNCTGTTSCTPTNAIGDLQLAYAFRDGSQTAPTVPAGWTSAGTGSINGTSTNDSSAVLACKIATSANEASGTFTNANALVVMVYSGVGGTTANCNTISIGTPSFFTSTVNTTTTTETFNSLTVGVATSWVVGFGGCSACTAGIGTAPSGMSNRSSVTGPPGAGGHDTNAAGSFSTANVTLTTAGRIITAVVEVKQAPSGGPRRVYVY
jgi:hypothetical protein